MASEPVGVKPAGFFVPGIPKMAAHVFFLVLMALFW
jgi:hypothetical protein